MLTACVLLITSDLPVCALEVWGVSEVQNMAVLTCLARPSHGSAKQCKSTEPSKMGCIAFCFGSVHVLNMQACALSTEWLRAISQAFLCHAWVVMWQLVALSQPVVVPLPIFHAWAVWMGNKNACASKPQRRTRCVSGYMSRKCAHAPRMTELLVTITEILLNDNYWLIY